MIGERYDTDAGLQYLNARYCDPVNGVDPKGNEVVADDIAIGAFFVAGIVYSYIATDNHDNEVSEASPVSTLPPPP